MVPVAFLSSTSEDLKDHREQAARAIEESGLAISRMESFASSAHLPSLPACLEKVDEAEGVVVLVAHRYGWVPTTGNPDAKSITWLECSRARETGKEVLAFLVDPAYDWPKDRYENYRLVTEQNKRGIRKEVKQNEKKLAEFK